MKIEKCTIPSSRDGLPLSCLVALPETEPKALVQFSHGMAEHKERYLPVMERLCAEGYACLINDHRGHGASVRDTEDLGYFYADGANALVDDLYVLTKFLKTRFPNRPLFLIGHSMGSLAVRVYAGRYGHEINGLIVSGSPGENPAAGMGVALTYVLALFGGSRRKSTLMDGMVNGPFMKRFPGGPFDWLSVNRENVAAYEADPLCGFRFTLNGYRALMKLVQGAYDRKNHVPENLPVHFMSGADDPCAPDRTGFDSAMEVMRARGARQVTGKMYPGLRHEIFNEKKEEVFADLVEMLNGWLKA